MKRAAGMFLRAARECCNRPASAPQCSAGSLSPVVQAAFGIIGWGSGLQAWQRSHASCRQEELEDEHGISPQQRSQAQALEAGPSGRTTEGESPKDMIAVFTCSKCDTRSAKPFSRQAYDHGVVIVQCPGCSARHLLADRLGWFGEAGSIEDVLADKGEKAVRKRDDGTMEITVEDIVGGGQRQHI